MNVRRCRLGCLSVGLAYWLRWFICSSVRAVREYRDNHTDIEREKRWKLNRPLLTSFRFRLSCLRWLSSEVDGGRGVGISIPRGLGWDRNRRMWYECEGRREHTE